MPPQPPFPNEYQKRLVSESDSKACNVCYKPTCTVLLASNQVDFFYVCPSHLKDVSFCSALHPEAYTKLLEERKALEKQVKDAMTEAEAHKPYPWTNIMNTIGWNKKDKDKLPKKDDENASKEEKEGTKEYESLIAAVRQHKSDLADLDEKIASFSFKKYQLNKDVYRIRVNNYIQGQLRAKRQKEIHDPSFFPQAPTGELQ